MFALDQHSNSFWWNKTIFRSIYFKHLKIYPYTIGPSIILYAFYLLLDFTKLRVFHHKIAVTKLPMTLSLAKFTLRIQNLSDEKIHRLQFLLFFFGSDSHKCCYMAHELYYASTTWFTTVLSGCNHDQSLGHCLLPSPSWDIPLAPFQG